MSNDFEVFAGIGGLITLWFLNLMFVTWLAEKKGTFFGKKIGCLLIPLVMLLPIASIIVIPVLYKRPDEIIGDALTWPKRTRKQSLKYMGYTLLFAIAIFIILLIFNYLVLSEY
jgi:hypothetical protein